MFIHSSAEVLIYFSSSHLQLLLEVCPLLIKCSKTFYFSKEPRRLLPLDLKHAKFIFGEVLFRLCNKIYIVFFERAPRHLILSILYRQRRSLEYTRSGQHLKVLPHLWSICITLEGIIKGFIKFVAMQLLHQWLQKTTILRGNPSNAKVQPCGQSIPSFLAYFKTLSISLTLGSEPAPFHLQSNAPSTELVFQLVIQEYKNIDIMNNIFTQ